MSSDTLLREVDEELRKDRVRKLWRQTGPWVIGAAVAVVLGVAGYEGWNWWTKSQSAGDSDQFYAAAELAEGEDLAGAKAAFDQVIAEGGGYAVLSQFREAALLAQQGDVDGAVAAYDAVATASSDSNLRGLALVLGASLLVDRGDVAGVEQRVNGELTDTSPMRNAAREVLGLTQYKAGQLDEALASLEAILNDPNASQDLRGRIQLYVMQLQAEGARSATPPVDEAAEAEGSAEAATSDAVLASSAEPVASTEASAAVDASTELAVTPPASTEPPTAPSSAAVSSAVDASSVAP